MAVADFIGYGGAATTTIIAMREADRHRLPRATIRYADFRKASGCTDTNDNAADTYWLLQEPFPRNTAAHRPTTASAGTPPNLTISTMSP